jgi:ribosomal protein S18 acetylase RimI-like enzyme
MQLVTVKSDKLYIYIDVLVDLYIGVFSSGKSFQYHTRDETKKYLQSIFDVGYGILAIEETRLLGAILLAPLSFDKLLPLEISQQFDVSRSLYVAEMMVNKKHQGKGIGKQLLQNFLKESDKTKFTNAFIRVWIENASAVGLYKKMGFKTCASIVQPKLLADKTQLFDFKKIYLHQKLD